MQKYLSLTLRLWKLMASYHKHFYLQLFSTIIQQILGIGITLIAAKMLDALITKNTHLIPWFIATYFVLSILRGRILGYFTDLHAIKYLDNSTLQFLEEYSFKKIFTLNPSQYSEGHSAIRLQTITRGESAVENIISTIMLSILPVTTQILFSIIAISFYSKTVALWSAITLIIIIYWSNKFSTFHRPYVQQNMENWDNQRKVRTEAFQHLTLIKILAAEFFYLKKYLKNRTAISEYRMLTFMLSLKHGYNRGFFMVISRTISTIIILFLAVKELITVGAVYAIWSWTNDAYSNIQTILQTIKNLPLRFIELEKYLEIIDTAPVFKESGDRTITSFKEITFNNVSFKYPQGIQDVFSGLSFTIPKEKTTAFVGESGSGKSTIVKLLTRSYDYGDGAIYVDGTNLRDIDARHLRSHIGYVEQHVDLFDETIKENILLGIDDKDKKHAEEKLEEVAHLARIDQFYHRLGEKKLDTVIGERGIKLSGGERQRIGIARAIIKDPEILIFDEATSSLDTENEKYVMDAIKEVSKGKTTIIIAHRLSTIRDADKIIVMDKGRVVGEGNHAELLAANSTYQSLIAHQV